MSTKTVDICLGFRFDAVAIGKSIKTLNLPGTVSASSQVYPLQMALASGGQSQFFQCLAAGTSASFCISRLDKGNAVPIGLWVASRASSGDGSYNFEMWSSSSSPFQDSTHKSLCFDSKPGKSNFASLSRVAAFPGASANWIVAHGSSSSSAVQLGMNNGTWEISFWLSVKDSSGNVKWFLGDPEGVIGGNDN